MASSRNHRAWSAPGLPLLNYRSTVLPAVACFAVLAACDTRSVLPELEEAPTGLELSVTSLELASGDTTRLEAVLVGSSGRPIPPPSAGSPKNVSHIGWTSSDATIAAVSRSGLVHAKRSGEATLIASTGNLARTATVRVRGNNKGIVVSPRVDTLTLNQTVELSALVLDPKGEVVPDAQVTWTSLRPNVARVDNIGNVTALAVGVALITAGARGQVDTATIHVRNDKPSVAGVSVSPSPGTVLSGETIQMTAIAVDDKGTVVSGVDFTWASSNSAIATVSSRGLVKGVAEGTATITAIANGVSSSVSPSFNISAALDADDLAPSQNTAGQPAGSAPIQVMRAGTIPPPPSQTGYSPRSPHWPHVRLEVTAWGKASEEIQFVAGHYDFLMDPRADLVDRFKSFNPTIKYTPYAVYLTVIQDGERLASNFMPDMERWYARNTQYRMEDAFLHSGSPKSSSNRMTASIWGSQRWLMNPGDPGYRAYTADRLRRMVTANPSWEADGIFIDEHDRGNVNRAQGSVEYPNFDAFHGAITGLIQYVRPRLGQNKILHLNVAESSGAEVDAWAAAAGSIHHEFFHHARREVWRRWERVDRLVGLGIQVQLVAGVSRASYEKYADWSAGNEMSKAARGKLFELASYYMVRPPADRIDLVRMTNLNGWGSSLAAEWTKAIEVDIGHPSETRRVYKEGTIPNPNDPSRTWPYRVWSRNYTNALVLARSMEEFSYTVYDDRTAVTISLPSNETWHMLYENGSLGPAITSVKLRNGEAAVLMKASRLSR